MVWEQGSVVIVNLTRLAEKDGTALCHRYWPEEGSDLYHIYEVRHETANPRKAVTSTTSTRLDMWPLVRGRQ